MNSSTWKPHGLIRTPQLEYYYQEARAPVDPNGNTAQDREDKSIRLFAQLLAKYVFPGNDYAVVPGPTPSTQARKPSDLVVERCTTNMDFEVLCFRRCQEAHQCCRGSGRLPRAASSEPLHGAPPCKPNLQARLRVHRCGNPHPLLDGDPRLRRQHGYDGHVVVVSTGVL